jgi:hypothetical protein
VTAQIPQLRTPGVLAAGVGAPLSQVLYILRTRDVRPIGRAGVLWLYDQAAVKSVRDALHELNQRRGLADAR